MPMVSFDPRLYDDYAAFEALDWTLETPVSRPLLFHCFWTGLLNELHALSIKSLMITQSPPYEIWLWMPPDDALRNRGFMSSLPHVVVKEYVPAEESRGTAYEGQGALLNGEDAFGGHRASNVANAFRILTLAKYGGVYFDLDVLFLRDIRHLCSVEFCYQWSDQPYGNNAVLHFNAGSPAISALAERSVQIGSCRAKALFIFQDIWTLLDGVYVFPSFLFDPVWIAHDRGEVMNDYCNTFADFFTSEARVGLSTFFPHAYTYHWHNYWDWPIRANTVIGYLRDEVDRLFCARSRL
jgi:hypothetical protein